MNDVFLARRHSKRLKNVLVSAHKEDVQCVIDEVILSGSEEPSHQEGGPSTVEEKVNYLLRKFQENQKIIEELKFKVSAISFSCFPFHFLHCTQLLVLIIVHFSHIIS